ncbi:PD-(D/E)XK nuclease family protein, partial [Alphaproteobacteria bacterium]|nr:PD-(D/E)XK nuclease family protein [Alphaproteobacteria bacterium]
VFLWGPLEARLQNVDKVIFGGMNEGSWPPKNHLNPWLTRHMSKQVGLPMPEYRIGLSAHDFVQCFSSSKEIIITRSKKIDGNETVKSRWFERINTLIGEPTGNELERISKINFFYKSLDSPFKIKKINPPFVCPPALVRPTNFSVSDIETIMHNPYAIYVKKILNIKPLREVNFTPDVKERGSFIHKALEKYIKNYIKINKEHNIGELDSIGMNLLGRKLKNPIVKIFWVPLFKRISKLFILLDDQKESFYEIFSEEKGQIEINNGSDIFILRAKADRLQKNKNNKIGVIDYKTGLIPKWSDVEFGIKPQLALESLIVERGGFESIGIKKVDNIHYWKLSDSNDQGIHSYNNSDQSINKLISNTEEGLLLLLENFKRSDIPYLAYPLNSPDTYDEFEQISRFKEWAGMFSINNKL